MSYYIVWAVSGTAPHCISFYNLQNAATIIRNNHILRSIDVFPTQPNHPFPIQTFYLFSDIRVFSSRQYREALSLSLHSVRHNPGFSVVCFQVFVGFDIIHKLFGCTIKFKFAIPSSIRDIGKVAQHH